MYHIPPLRYLPILQPSHAQGARQQPRPGTYWQRAKKASSCGHEVAAEQNIISCARGSADSPGRIPAANGGLLAVKAECILLRPYK